MDRANENLDWTKFYNALREGSMGWKNARTEFDLITEIKPADLGIRHKDYSEVNNTIIRAKEVLMKILGGGLNALADRAFIIDYELRCNLLGNATNGTECVGLSFAVRWERQPIEVVFAAATNHSSMLNAELDSFTNSAKVGDWDLNKFAMCTGLPFGEVKNTKSNEIGTLLKMYTAAKRGQNKMSRLVKGYLLYLDRCDEGDLIYPGFEPTVVKYTCEGLSECYTDSEAAYVWNGDSDAIAYSIVLYSMCEAYPHPVFGGMGHIKIGADARIIKMVSYHSIKTTHPVEVSPEIVWGALVKYCDIMGISGDLEEAMIIACSIRENRYLKKVTLPYVVSNVDLVFPALADPRVSCSNQTRMGLPSATVMGRVHQMMCLNLVRDLDVCAHATAVCSSGVLRTVRSYIGKDHWTFLNYMDDKAQVDLLKKSRSMSWMSYLSDNDIVAMRKYSVFESFWLIDNPQQVLRDGVIRCLKKGEKSPIGIHRDYDAYSTLLKEIKTAGHPDNEDIVVIPDGGFNVRLSCVRGQRVVPVDIYFDGEIDHTFEYKSMDEACTETAYTEEQMDMGWEISSDFEYE